MEFDRFANVLGQLRRIDEGDEAARPRHNQKGIRRRRSPCTVAAVLNPMPPRGARSRVGHFNEAGGEPPGAELERCPVPDDGVARARALELGGEDRKRGGESRLTTRAHRR